MKMNKQDVMLIIILISVTILIFLLTSIYQAKVNIANVYYEDEIVLSIDLTKKQKQEFIVKGYNGDVVIVAKDGKVKVDEEKSPLHLCSNQGWISKSYETIVCLPNKVVIQLDQDKDLDTIVK